MSKTKQQSATVEKKQHHVRQQYRVIDDATRSRRSRQFLEQLERDNFHDDPHANLVMHKKAPKFDDTVKQGAAGGGGGRRHAHRTKMLSWSALIEEDSRTPAPNYGSASAPAPSNVVTPDGRLLMSFPKRHFCSVCGFKSPYTCVTCGSRYCSVTCLGTHRDTRCLKWTA
ncbi:Zinc finger HIT domain-containing protein 1 [Halotydeus destructor]|nr:Zinc finger HIT domain-containing protein 1 [Halotydeus destructor]